MGAGEGKRSGNQGLRKSEQTIKWCNQIAEELKKGDRSTYELRTMFGIKEELFPSILLQLTYIAPVYDYKIKNKLYLGLIKN